MATAARGEVRALGRDDPGRVFLGVGTGEAVNEAATGQFGRYRERADRLVEAVTRL